MAQIVAVTLRIHGHVGTQDFANWICHRARILDLTGSVRILNSTEIEVVACGDDVLVDAMEVTCHLGPANVQVDRIDCIPFEPAITPSGFRLK